MVIVKWSDKVEGSGDSIYVTLYGGLYKKEENYLVPWSETDPYAKMNCFTRSKKDNYWIVLGDQYNESSKTEKDLSIRVNSAHMPSRRRERQRIHAPIMEALSSLMTFLGKETQKYPASPTMINAVSIWLGMECGMYSPLQYRLIKRKSWIFL